MEAVRYKKPLFDKLSVFRKPRQDLALFPDVTVDVGGCGIVWGDDLDLSCQELWREAN